MENFERIKELKKERILERRRQRRNKLLWHVAICSAVAVILLSIAMVVLQTQKNALEEENQGELGLRVENAPTINTQLLFVGDISRPGTKLEQVKAIVIHATTAKHESASHYSISDSGEIIQFIPLEESSNVVIERTTDTISIECSVQNQEGRLGGATYDALVELTAWLVGEYDLKLSDIIRHQEIDGSLCPEYFTDNESAWEDFKLDVEKYIEENGVKK